MTLDHETKQEIKAIMMEKHPLKYSHMKGKHIFPFLRWFSGGEGSEKVMPADKNEFLDKNYKKSDDINDDKPEERMKVAKNKSKMGFLNLGYGFVAYYSFMEFMIVLFSILTIISLPSLYFYMTFRTNPNARAGILDKFSLANLGYSATLGNAVHIEMGKLTLSGETGQMDELVSFGIIPPKSKVPDAGLETEETKQGIGILSTKNLGEHILDDCIGKRNGSLPFGKFIKK